MPASFLLLLAAQFASALADNALLIVTIDLLQQRAMPGWLAPMLKVAFIAAYVLLGAVRGPAGGRVPQGQADDVHERRQDLRRAGADLRRASRGGVPGRRARRGRVCAGQVRPGHGAGALRPAGRRQRVDRDGCRHRRAAGHGPRRLPRQSVAAHARQPRGGRRVRPGAPVAADPAGRLPAGRDAQPRRARQRRAPRHRVAAPARDAARLRAGQPRAVGRPRRRAVAGRHHHLLGRGCHAAVRGAALGARDDAPVAGPRRVPAGRGGGGRDRGRGRGRALGAVGPRQAHAAGRRGVRPAHDRRRVREAAGTWPPAC